MNAKTLPGTADVTTHKITRYLELRPVFIYLVNHQFSSNVMIQGTKIYIKSIYTATEK